ncbi:hypothetical protein D3C76_1272780 [compost metagenome]
MGGVHVHQHQADGVFGKDIDALELGQGVTQRRDVALAFGQCSRRGIVQWGKELTVHTLGFGRRQCLGWPRCVLILIASTTAIAAQGRAQAWLGRRLLEQIGGQAHLALRPELTRLNAAGTDDLAGRSRRGQLVFRAHIGQGAVQGAV